jgi:Arc/MetJ-type ribon-helix-helix transcriptional regulator
MADPDKTLVPGEVTVEHKGDPAHRDAGTEARVRLEEFKTSVKDFAQKIPDQIGKAFETLKDRMNSITVHVDDETQRRIDTLVEAGIFKTRGESAAYLLHEGIRARSDVFGAIDEKLVEIERLKTDLRDLVVPPEPDSEG